MALATESVNPRHLREKLSGWLGKRVVVGTHTFHYLCGIWKSMEGDHVFFEIGGKEMRVGLSDIATVGEPEAWQADFYK